MALHGVQLRQAQPSAGRDTPREGAPRQRRARALRDGELFDGRAQRRVRQREHLAPPARLRHQQPARLQRGQRLGAAVAAAPDRGAQIGGRRALRAARREQRAPRQRAARRAAHLGEPDRGQHRRPAAAAIAAQRREPQIDDRARRQLHVQRTARALARQVGGDGGGQAALERRPRLHRAALQDVGDDRLGQPRQRQGARRAGLAGLWRQRHQQRVQARARLVVDGQHQPRTRRLFHHAQRQLGDGGDAGRGRARRHAGRHERLLELIEDQHHAALGVAYIVNAAIQSQTGTAAEMVGPILIPLLLAGRVRPLTAGAVLLLGSSMGGELCNPGRSRSSRWPTSTRSPSRPSR